MQGQYFEEELELELFYNLNRMYSAGVGGIHRLTRLALAVD